jgi:hypothetical protein
MLRPKGLLAVAVGGEMVSYAGTGFVRWLEALIVETVSAPGPPDMQARNCDGP